MQACTKCPRVLDEAEFSWKDRSRKLRSAHCKSCQRDISKRHYKNNKQMYIDRNNKAFEEVNTYIKNYKSTHSCKDCGLKFHFFVMDFDHLPGHIKLDNISNLVRCYTLATVRTEIEKCDLVCANCHRTRTFNRM